MRPHLPSRLLAQWSPALGPPLGLQGHRGLTTDRAPCPSSTRQRPAYGGTRCPRRLSRACTQPGKLSLGWSLEAAPQPWHPRPRDYGEVKKLSTTDGPRAGGQPVLPSLVGSALPPQAQSGDRSSKFSLSPHLLPAGGPANSQVQMPDRNSRRPEGWVAMTLREEGETSKHLQSPVSRTEVGDARSPAGLPSLD